MVEICFKTIQEVVGKEWGYRCYKGDGYIASTKWLCFCLNLSILKPKRTKYQATRKTWVAMEISVPSTDGKIYNSQQNETEIYQRRTFMYF